MTRSAPRERDVDAPEQVPGGRAIDKGRFRNLGWHVHEVGAHPEDGKGHVQADQRQHDREPSVVDPDRPLQVVERDDDAPEGQRQSKHKQEQKHARTGDPQETDGERCHGRDDQRNRHHGNHDERTRCQERGHVRHFERFDKVAPLRVCGPFEPLGTVPDGCSAVVKMLMKGRIVIAISTRSRARPAKSSPRPTFIAWSPGSAAG